MTPRLVVRGVALAVVVMCAHAIDVRYHDVESAAVAGNQMGITATRRTAVYLPDGYAETRRSYPVVYWLPGWETPASREYVSALDHAIDRGWIPPMIVVSVDVREGILLLSSHAFGRWEEFLVDEVVPLVDREYRTIPISAGRGLMGHSTGGYTAMLLPLRRPGVWSAVGLNDPSVWIACDDEVRAPDTLANYAAQDGHTRTVIQFGHAVTPNPPAPRGFDTPAETAVERAWARHRLMDAETVAANRDALLDLAPVAIVVPAQGGGTNRIWNLRFRDALQAQGVNVVWRDSPGTHGSNRPERLITLLLTVGPQLTRPFPDPTRAKIAAWATLKHEHAR